MLSLIYFVSISLIVFYYLSADPEMCYLFLSYWILLTLLLLHLFTWLTSNICRLTWIEKLKVSLVRGDERRGRVIGGRPWLEACVHYSRFHSRKSQLSSIRHRVKPESRPFIYLSVTISRYPSIHPPARPTINLSRCSFWAEIQISDG